ncbi:MAG: hypothetical protein AAF961_10465 [Planctomycetota bacterium]
MPNGDASRREYLTLAALDPVTGQAGVVQISYDRMQAVGRRSMGHAKECGHLVPAILQSPQAVFEGLREDQDEDPRGVGWRCYCGIPDKAYHPDGSERRPYKAQVYVVFVNDENVAYNWRWEKADPDDPSLPVNHFHRFRQRIL